MASISATTDDIPSGSLAMDVPGWRRSLVILILLTGGVKSTLAFTTIVPGLQMIAAEYGGKDPILGAQRLLQFAPFGMALAGLVAGLFVRPKNIRGTMFIALGISCVAGLLPLVVHNYSMLLGSRFVLGFSAVVADVAMTSALAAYFTGALRAKLIGFRQAFSHVGTVLTFAVSGFLMHSYGWRAASLMFVVPGILLVLAFIAFDRPIKDDTTVFVGSFGEKTKSFLSELLNLMPLLILCALMALGHAMPSYQMPFLLRENGITDTRLISFVPSLSAGISILSALIFGFVYARAGWITLALASTAMGIGFIGVGLTTNYYVILSFIVIEGIGAGWTMPFFLAQILDRTVATMRRVAIGLTLSFMFFGQSLNADVTKAIRDQVGLHMAFVVVGIALFVIAAAIALWANTRKPTAGRVFKPDPAA
ncbi:MAG: MFS transporter [Pseudomonadota bacterium]